MRVSLLRSILRGCVRTQDLFWHEKIAELRAAHPQRFAVETILSREQRDGSLHGRVTSEVLGTVFDGAWGTGAADGAGGPNVDKRGTVRFLTVGTKPMMRETETMFGRIGYAVRGEHALLGRGEGAGEGGSKQGKGKRSKNGGQAHEAKVDDGNCAPVSKM